MKKRNIILFGLAFALVAPVVLLLSGCGGNKSEQTLKAKDVYAMAAFSSVNFLQQSPSASGMDATSDVRPSEITDSEVASIASYMGMFEDLLANENKTYYTTAKIAEGEEYFGTYTFKMTFSVGSQSDMAMYYIEKDLETETNIEEDETEISAKIEGIIKAGQEEFRVEGKREYEKEGNEEEMSLEFTTFSNENENDYIKVEHSVENEETEFEYTIFKNGVETKTEVEFENDDEKKLELEFSTTTTTTENEVKYEITKSNTTDNLFNVKMKSSTNDKDVKQTFTITVTEAGYLFTYANGFTETI